MLPPLCRYGKEPEAQLNPKKKQFERIAPDLRVDASERLPAPPWLAVLSRRGMEGCGQRAGAAA